MGLGLANTRISQSVVLPMEQFGLSGARKAHVSGIKHPHITLSTELKGMTAHDRGTQASSPAMTLGLHIPQKQCRKLAASRPCQCNQQDQS